MVWLLFAAAEVRIAAAQALSLCARSVIPSLFPFMVVSSLLISMGAGGLFSSLFAGVMTPLFHLPGCAGSALLLGLMGGYPIGAQTAAQLYQQGRLTREEAQRLLFFCNNAGAAFFISVLGAGVFSSSRIGLWLWLIHVAAALLTGCIFRGRGAVSARRQVWPPPPAVPPFSSAFVSAVRTCAGTMLHICAFVVVFYVLVQPLAALGGVAGAVLTGGMELFSLLPLLSADRFSFVLASAAAGWGGLSVLFQTASVLEGSGLSLRSVWGGKLVQSALSAAMSLPLSFSLFP